jgi:hypothetical protein
LEVAPVLGYRHISGIEPWDPWAKARFIATVIEEQGKTFEETASLVGESENIVRSHYRDYRVVRQSRDDFGIETDDIEENFGVFTRALQSLQVRSFIGVPAPREIATGTDPIPEDKRDEARELITWLFGRSPGDQTGRVIRESRDIGQLGTVLGSEDAVRVLRETGNLEEAFQTAGGVRGRLASQLMQARNNLRRAREDFAQYAGDEEINQLVHECQDALNALLELD